MAIPAAGVPRAPHAGPPEPELELHRVPPQRSPYAPHQCAAPSGTQPIFRREKFVALRIHLLYVEVLKAAARKPACRRSSAIDFLCQAPTPSPTSSSGTSEPPSSPQVPIHSRTHPPINRSAARSTPGTFVKNQDLRDLLQTFFSSAGAHFPLACYIFKPTAVKG